MRINPVYKKELKTRIRSVKTAVILFSYNGLLALFGLFSFYITFEYKNKYGGVVNYSDILKIYAIITAMEFGLVLFIVPGLTSGSISSEREKQTLEILLTTKLSPLQIILGKLASSISMIIMLAFSSLPILALTFSIGGISFIDLLEFIVLITVTAVYIGSVGIFFSTLFKKTTAATVTTYGILLVIGLGTVLILWGVTSLLGLKMNLLMPNSEVKPSPNLGNFILILLINPAVTCFSMIESQIGTGSRLTDFFGRFGSVSLGIQNNWFLLSVSLQLIISLVLIWFSSKLLNPLRQRKGEINNK